MDLVCKIFMTIAFASTGIEVQLSIELSMLLILGGASDMTLTNMLVVSG